MAEFVDLKISDGSPSCDLEFRSAIYEQIDQIIGQNTTLSDSQRERCKSRFRKVYECLQSQKNEYEAEDNAVKEVASMRKKYPVAIKKAYTAIVNQETLALSTCTIKPEPTNHCEETVVNTDEDVVNEFKDMKNVLVSLTESTSNLTMKAERLKEAMDIENGNKVQQKTHISDCSSPLRKRHKTLNETNHIQSS
ncbi:hypothetical protein LOTGIDRAFT_233945 [Lottia gigantea]|uniref:Uncharacterized protein n=1 Tax=Lottia gigantea TaxID=225164 RepID=V4BMI8_LOTGI|nr:hypothetical protein LOTGIDRAFT_233945 [Lottia gigantea]ESO90149.1 hypothetical protein LOTGIDRAFT_233945 [Lottia gigantea]